MEEKTVTFNENVSVKYQYTWNFAYRMARNRYWEYFAVDRMRFKRRIERMEDLLKPVFNKMIK